MLERDIEKSVSSFAKRNGWLHFKWKSMNRNGVPDRLFFKNGILKIVEFKATGGAPTPLQLLRHKQLEDQDFKVYVIDNIEDGKKLFK